LPSVTPPQQREGKIKIRFPAAISRAPKAAERKRLENHEKIRMVRVDGSGDQWGCVEYWWR